MNDSSADQEEPVNASTHDALEKPDDGALDAHRAIAREYNLRAQKVYSRGGSIAFIAAAIPIGFGWWFSRLLTPTPWVLAVLLFLVTLYFVRSRIRVHLAKLGEEFARYCETNALAPDEVFAYFEARQEYPFFVVMGQESGKKALPQEPLGDGGR